MFFKGSMELHVVENYYNTLGYCEATCSFHVIIIYFLMATWNTHIIIFGLCEILLMAIS
jgi:hypothetical protein